MKTLANNASLHKYGLCIARTWRVIFFAHDIFKNNATKLVIIFNDIQSTGKPEVLQRTPS